MGKKADNMRAMVKMLRLVFRDMSHNVRVDTGNEKHDEIYAEGYRVALANVNDWLDALEEFDTPKDLLAECPWIANLRDA
jgi:hypothetical protein